MALDQCAGVQWHLELRFQVLHAIGFRFAAAIGEQDAWDVVLPQVGQRLGGPGDGRRRTDEDAIDTVRT